MLGSEDLWTATQCVEKGGDYVEKWYTLQLSQGVVHEVINEPSSLYFFYSASHKYNEGLYSDNLVNEGNSSRNHIR